MTFDRRPAGPYSGHMRVALVQNLPIFGKKKENVERLFSLIDREPAALYVLPEMAYTG